MSPPRDELFHVASVSYLRAILTPYDASTNIALMASMDDPGALLERIASTQWDTVARHAWSQYQQRGRGAIVFSLQQPGTRGKEPLRYLTFKGNRDEIERSSMAMLYQLVESYDPREEVVVAVVLPDERTVFDVFSKTPRPAATTS